MNVDNEDYDKLLIAASFVLKEETLDRIKETTEIGIRGYKILDRWALSSREKLIDLEKQGFSAFFNRLYKQQELELSVLVQNFQQYPDLTEYQILFTLDVPMAI